MFECLLGRHLFSKMRKRMIAAVSLGWSGINGRSATITWLSRGPRCEGSTLLTKHSHVLSPGNQNKHVRLHRTDVKSLVTFWRRGSAKTLTGNRAEGSLLCSAGQCGASSSSSLALSWCVWNPSGASTQSHSSKPKWKSDQCCNLNIK